MDLGPLNSTDLISLTKDILLNFTTGTDADLASAIGFENTTTILLHVSGGNESLAQFLRNVSLTNESVAGDQLRKSMNVSSGIKMLIKV